MAGKANALASSEEFEFAALAEARNYRAALIHEFQPALRGRVLEVGAGIGQFSEALARLPEVTELVCVEPEKRFCARLRQRLPGVRLIEGTVAEVPSTEAWDCVVSVNVLEHIEDDAGELARYAGLLRRKQGFLCLFVPACPEIYAHIDRDFGHYRRYRKRELRDKLVEVGFQVERLRYYNSVGYFAWWLSFGLLRRRGVHPASVRLFDRWVFPAVHAMETRVAAPPFGQSLFAVARPICPSKPASSVSKVSASRPLPGPGDIGSPLTG